MVAIYWKNGKKVVSQRETKVTANKEKGVLQDWQEHSLAEEDFNETEQITGLITAVVVDDGSIFLWISLTSLSAS